MKMIPLLDISWQANYDNTGNMAKSITYYAVTQADLNDYAKDSDPNRADDVLRWKRRPK